MTWGEFNKKNFDLTKKDVAPLRARVMREYSEAMKEIDAEIKKIYDEILSGVKPEDYYNTVIKYNRLRNMKKRITSIYTVRSKNADKYITNASRVAISNNYYRTMYSMQWLQPEILPGLLPEDIINLSVRGTEESFKKLTARVMQRFGEAENYMPKAGTLSEFLAKDRREAIGKIQRELQRGLVQGKGYRQNVAGVKKIIGQYSSVKSSGAKANALRIITTETHRNMNAGAYAAQKNAAAQGVRMERQISAVLDDRTRPQSAQMDGQTVGIDEPFQYPGGVTAMFPGETGVARYDINDRETVISIVDGKGPKIRRGRNPWNEKENEVFTHKNFREWAEDKGLEYNRYGELLPSK